MLFLDLEIFVPPADRKSSTSSMVANPTRPGDVLLGGCFYSTTFVDPVLTNPKVEHLWIW